MEKITTSRRAPFGSNPKVGEAGRATQQRILTAAAEAFAATGYARTTVEAITDRAGCSRPTFYQYFSGKEDLHRRLSGRLGGELSDLFHRVGAVGPDAAGRDVLRQWLEEMISIHARYRAVADTFSASLRTDERMVSGAADLSAEYGSSLAAVLDSSATAPVALEVMAGAANITAYGACLYREQIGHVSAGRLAASLADCLHRTFFGPIAGVNLAPHVAATAPSRDGPTADPSALADGTRRERGRATRQRLLDAALTAYGMLGYDAVRVDDISTEAGMSHGTFYRYFPGKEAIFDEHADAASAVMTALLEELPVEPSTERRWAKAYYQHYEQCSGVIACMQEARAAGALGAIRAQRDVTTALAASLGKRKFGDVDADIVICFSLFENVPAAAYGYSGLTFDEATEATAVLLGRGVFGHELA